MVVLAGALAGWGYWALVGSQVAASILWTALVTVAAPTRLARPTRRVLAGALAFTRHQLTGSAAWYLYSTADFVVAGRVLGARELGTYSLAWTFARIVPERLANVVIGVAPSFLAAVRDEPAVLRQWIYTLTEALAVVTFPLLVGMALTADDLVHFAAGDRWQGAVMPLRLLALYGAFDSVVQLVTRGLVAAGDVRFTARLGLLLAAVMPLAFLAARGGVRPASLLRGWRRRRPAAWCCCSVHDAGSASSRAATAPRCGRRRAPPQSWRLPSSPCAPSHRSMRRACARSPR